MRGFDRPTTDTFLADLAETLGPFRPSLPPPPVDPATQPIVWIVGTPRSGTTLLAELLTASTDIGFVDNLAARFPEHPETGMLLSASLRPATGAAGGVGRGVVTGAGTGVVTGAGTGAEAEPGAVTGTAAPRAAFPPFDIGRTQGPHGTHEFGFFWSRWLGLRPDAAHRLDGPARVAVDRNGLRTQLHRMIAVAGGPFLVRNVICGLNAALLAEVHPASVFVELQRDPAATAASILTCRRRRGGGARHWWSLRPSTWRPDRLAPSSDAAAAAECARQVLDIRRDLADERAAVERAAGSAGGSAAGSAGGSAGGPSTTSARWRTVQYADLCTDPAAVVGEIVADVVALGGKLDHRPPPMAPEPARAAPQLPDEEAQAIVDELSADDR
ncbi:MAG: hypothetical protein AB8G96_04535 [Phycisphaerales bacterium]